MSNFRKFPNILSTWSFFWILLEHSKDKFLNLIGIASFLRQRLNNTAFDLLTELDLAFSFKRWSKTCNFINNTSKRPNVWFMIILKICYLFRTHIVWSSNMSCRKHRFFIHLSWKSKIPNFYICIFIKKDVSWFKISMKNSWTFFWRIMTIRQSVRNLCNYFPQ